MFRNRPMTRLVLSALLAVLPLAVAYAGPPRTAAKAPAVVVTRVTWHGWSDALRLSNGVVEAIVVPSIGRVMAFEFVGAPGTNPIFVNKDWTGKSVADADAATWAAFGGDKLWPSPQADWIRHNVRAWPPDQAFDGDPEIARVVPGGIRLITPVSTAFAARAVRVITMKAGQPRLYIAQTILKDPDAANPAVRAAPPADTDSAEEQRVAREQRDGFPLGIWSVTQTRGDETVFLPLSKSLTFPRGFAGLDAAPVTTYIAPYFTAEGDILRILHDPKVGRKVGTSSPEGWIAALYSGNVVFSEHYPTPSLGTYPDGGAAAEVYMNPDPSYIEMELLGPVAPLSHSDKVSYNIYWQLGRLPRVPTSRAEAQALVQAAVR